MKTIMHLPITILLTLLIFQLSAQCDGQATFIDARDGRVYNQVTIANQCWMQENLAWLPSVVGPAVGGVGTPFYYVYGYNGTDVPTAKASSNYNTYGVLYNWDAAMNGSGSSSTNPSGVQGACPVGWHLPSDNEWCELENVLENDPNYCSNIGYRGIDVGAKMKESGTTNWTSPNNCGSGCNTASFKALPGGSRTPVSGGYFPSNINNLGVWWTATESSSTNGFMRLLNYSDARSFRDGFDKANGYAVRCVRDIAPWPLPVEFLYFKANWTNDSYESVTLSWETISEIESSYFEVERSIDAVNFELIKTINGNGNTNQNIFYTTLDESPYKEGISYYRLKQIDNNGDFDYSNIEALNVPEGLTLINLYPNPVGDQFRISLTASTNDAVTINIRNSLGQTTRKVNGQVSKGYNSFNIDVSEFSSGNYFIEIITQSSLYKVERKFIKGK